MNRERDERRWRRVAEVLLDEAHHMSTTKTRAEKLVEVAQIWDGQLHEPAKASGFYAEAAELDQAIAPKAIKLLMGLAQRTGEAAVNRILLDVLERTGREAELIKALQFIADREADPAGALVLYLKAGFMAAESVGDRLASRACLVSAHRVAEDAGDLKVLEQATRHLKIWPADEVVAALRAMLLVENERAQDAVDTLVTASIHASESKVKAKLRLRAAAVAGRSGVGADAKRGTAASTSSGEIEPWLGLGLGLAA